MITSQGKALLEKLLLARHLGATITFSPEEVGPVVHHIATLEVLYEGLFKFTNDLLQRDSGVGLIRNPDAFVYDPAKDPKPYRAPNPAAFDPPKST